MPQPTRRWTAARASDVISTPDRSDRPSWVVLGRTDDGVEAALLDADADELSRLTLSTSAFLTWLSETEAAAAPRWVWNDAPAWYPALLAAGVRLARCHDLRLCHAIL